MPSEAFAVLPVQRRHVCRYISLNACGSVRKKSGSGTSRGKKKTVGRRPAPAPVRDPGSAYAKGFFAAIVGGPMVIPGIWLQRFLPSGLGSPDELNARVQRVMAAHNQVAHVLMQQREQFGDVTLELARLDVRGGLLADWAHGFADALELSPEDWRGFLDGIDRKDLLQPLATIIQLWEDPNKREWLADRELREGLGRAVGIMTVRIWEMYRDQPEVQVVFADDMPERVPKILPNAPCPCGSGKKYTKCCSQLRSL